MLSACRTDKGASHSPSPTSVFSPNPAPPPSAPISNEASVLVSAHYDPNDGKNLQPAFQAAIDHAARTGERKVTNDLAVSEAEMWCPIRTSPYGLQPDGIPLVVRQPMTIDFRGLSIRLKGPNGQDRMAGQPVEGYDKPWLGGWLYVVGHDQFDLISIENVTVDGGFHGSFQTNDDHNLTDKGFRIQDTPVDEAVLKNVELRNFGGEIYYIGGFGPEKQTLEDCHFHGSAQCAFNPGGIGKLTARNLQAGRAYQVAESVGGKGHKYVGCRFYDAGYGGGTFLGGPAPSFRNGYHYSYAHWDGAGAKPWVIFEDTKFEYCDFVRVGSWVKGNLDLTDTAVLPWFEVGELRDIDLSINSVIDKSNGAAAVGIDGPRDSVTQVPLTPVGTYFQVPRDISLKIHCVRSNQARENGSRHGAAIEFYGGLIDVGSLSIQISGEARGATQLIGSIAPGFEMPQVLQNGFVTLG